jgi:hypothetical protein
LEFRNVDFSEGGNPREKILSKGENQHLYTYMVEGPGIEPWLTVPSTLIAMPPTHNLHILNVVYLREASIMSTLKSFLPLLLKLTKHLAITPAINSTMQD